MLADLMDDGTDSAGDPVPAKVDPRCPCGSGKDYAACCGPHHETAARPKAVERKFCRHPPALLA